MQCVVAVQSTDSETVSSLLFQKHTFDVAFQVGVDQHLRLQMRTAVFWTIMCNYGKASVLGKLLLILLVTQKELIRDLKDLKL